MVTGKPCQSCTVSESQRPWWKFLLFGGRTDGAIGCPTDPIDDDIGDDDVVDDDISDDDISDDDISDDDDTTPATTTVTIDGRTILVNGSPFTTKGVCYHPNPIGTTVDEYPYGDYFTADYSDIYERDIPYLEDLGANAIRLFGWDASANARMTAGQPVVREDHLFFAADQRAAQVCNMDMRADHSDFLNQLYDAGVYVVAGLWYDPSQACSESYQATFQQDFLEMVDAYQDNPAILMWVAGNEVTFFNSGCMDGWYEFVNETAAAAHALEGENYHPVGTVILAYDTISSSLGIGEIEDYNAQVPELDVWLVNLYPFLDGMSAPYMQEFFDDYESASTKPLLISEYGVDAFDNGAGSVDEETQSDYVMMLYDNIDTEPICSGGFIFEYSDEWWKGGSPLSHDGGGYSTNAQPDGYANEEWWGMMEVSTDPYGGVDIMEPRQVYYDLQAEWNP